MLLEELNKILTINAIEMRLVTSGCVVVNNGQCLVIVTNKNGPELPKGHINLSETPQEAAIRETKEETGITCKIIKEKPIIIQRPNGKHAFYLAKYISGSLNPSSKAEKGIIKSAWIPTQELIKIFRRRNSPQLEVLEKMF